MALGKMAFGQLRRSIRMGLAEELMNWLNSVDTSEMTAGDVRSAVYHKLMDVK